MENNGHVQYKNGVIFVDFDGCLSLSDWRESLLPRNGLEKNFDRFHEMGAYDNPNYPIIDLINKMHFKKVKVVVLTGRPEAYRTASSDWLRKYGVCYDWMKMRGNDDDRPSEIFKAEYIANFYKGEIRMIFDDMPKIITHLKERGYPTFQVTNTL